MINDEDVILQLLHQRILVLVSLFFQQIFLTWSSPNVILNVCGEDAHISVCCPKKSGLFTIICYVLEKHKIDIVSAQISSDQFRSMFMIQAHVSPFIFIKIICCRF